MRLILLPLFVVALRSIVSSQTACSPFQTMAEDCASACLNCNFAEQSGNTSTFTGGFALGFCGFLHNDQWMGFVAGGPVATITLTPSNCQNGDGLQLALYADCNSSSIDCNPGLSGGGADTLRLVNVPLVYGQPYFIVVDGFNQDICDFTLGISPFSAVRPPDVLTPAIINGPSKICPNSTAIYDIDSQSDGAAHYIWDAPPGSTINGQVPPVTIAKLNGGDRVMVTFGSVGGSVSVTPTNICKTGGQQSKTVTVAPVPPTILPAVYVCPEAYPDLHGTATISTTYVSASGCDSTVIATLTARPPAVANLGTLLLCPDDSIQVCGQYYKNAGDYSVKCTSLAGCDSLTSFKIAKQPVAIAGGGSLNCFNGAVPLQAVGGTGSAIWKNAAGQIVGTDSAYTATTAGKYTLEWTTVANGKVCTSTRDITVREVDTLRISTQPTRLLTCYEPNIALKVTTNMPARFEWAGPGGYTSTQTNPMVPMPGQYTVYATTSGGCTASATITVEQSIAVPNLSVADGVLTCTNPSIQLDAVSSNAPQTLRYEWTGPNGFINLLKSPNVSVPGQYTVVVTDMLNGCNNSATATVRLDAAPLAVSAVGGTLNCIVQAITLSVSFSNVANPVIQWTGPDNFISSQVAPSASIPGTYTVVVTNPANGCTEAASVIVTADFSQPTVQATGGVLDCNPPALPISCVTDIANGKFAWAGPNGFRANLQIPMVSRPGTYRVTVTNPDNGCTSSASAVVLKNGDAPQVVLSVSSIGGGKRQINCFTTAVVPTFVWTGPNGFASTDQSPVITTAGVYLVLVTDGISDCQTYQSIVVPVFTSLSGNTTGGRQAPVGGWQVYPNPSPDKVQLRYSGDDKPGQTYVAVLDGLGRIVWERNLSEALEISMDLGALPEGLYRILLHTDLGIETKNFSIQR